MVINGIGGAGGVTGMSQAFPAAGSEAKPVSSTDSAGRFAGELFSKVNELQLQSNKAVQELMTGESKGLHEVMLAMEKANISFQFMSQVRNKALDAYNEIMRMQV